MMDETAGHTCAEGTAITGTDRPPQPCAGRPGLAGWTPRAEFLASRPAKITPPQAGPPACGSNRRVPGLHREEVSLLAGVSIDHYARLAGASAEVLGAFAGALQLDEAGRAQLHHLARAAGTRAARRTRRTRGPIPAGVHGTTRAARPHPDRLQRRASDPGPRCAPAAGHLGRDRGHSRGHHDADRRAAVLTVSSRLRMAADPIRHGSAATDEAEWWSGTCPSPSSSETTEPARCGSGVHAASRPMRSLVRVRVRRREMCIWDRPNARPISAWVIS